MVQSSVDETHYTVLELAQGPRATQDDIRKVQCTVLGRSLTRNRRTCLASIRSKRVTQGTRMRRAGSGQSACTCANCAQAFYRLARTHHPDKGGSEEAFARLQLAAATLLDPRKKQVYDGQVRDLADALPCRHPALGTLLAAPCAS